MAAVTNICMQQKRRVRSQENLQEEARHGHKGKDLVTDTGCEVGSKYVMDLLSQLPPSRELLQHYQAKLAQYEEEERQLEARVAACAQLLDTSNRLEQELVRRETEVERLRAEVEKVSIKLHSERAKFIKLEADNDRLRIKDIENERKVGLLLKLSGKKDQEVVQLLEKGVTGGKVGEGGSAKVQKYLEKAGERRAAGARSSLSLETEIEQLSQQLVEQEKLHREQLCGEREVHRRTDSAHLADKKMLREKIADYQKIVAGMENQMTVLSDQLSSQKNMHRRNENKWTNEKTVLVRKLQFFEKFGTLEGTHSDHRAKARLTSGGDKKLLAKVRGLEKELEGKESELEGCRGQLIRLRQEQEMDKNKAEAAGSILAKKTKSMTEQVTTLTERCQKLESRKALEAAGYQSDIRLLRDKMSQLEDKLLSLSLASSKEKENEKLLEQLRQELRRVEQSKPRVWRN